MSLPDWITKDLIESALKKYLKINHLNVIGIMSQFAVPAGDNYCSDLFRTSVKYKSNNSGNIKTISLIIKCKPEEGIMNAITNEIPVFEKETNVFNKALIKLHELLGEKCLAADCLLAEVKDHGFLIIQDLGPLGYKMADRRAGLDMDHCFLVMEKIAKMHASSAVLYEKDPHSMDNYDKGIYVNQQDSKVAAHFLNSGFKSLITAVNKWDGYQKYASKLAALANTAFEKTVKSCARRPGFNVLNHGDLWTNNILFQYNSKEKLIDLRFVDFQFSVFTTPALDLQYFIHTSPTEKIHRKHLNRLLEYYYEELVDNLKKLKYCTERIPSFDDIQKEFYKSGFYGLASSATVLPIVRAPGREDATVDELFKSDDKDTGFRQISYNTPEYKTMMEHLLPYFDKLGVYL